MPGLLGITSRTPDRARQRFDLALARMSRHGHRPSASVATSDRCCLLGRVDRSAASEPDQSERSQPAISALIHGVVYNPAELRRRISHRGGPTDSLADLLVALYRELGVDFVDQLRGEFCLAVLDEPAKRLHVATDAIGNYPVYWQVDGDGLGFGSDLSALLASSAARARLDLEAVADYLTLGAVLDDKTLAAGVRTLSPGSVLTYTIGDASAGVHQYLDVQTFFQQKSLDRAQYLEAVQASFKSAVHRAVSETDHVGLSLSGGLDSRALLGAANGRSASLRTYTLGVEGCADQVIAEQLSRLAGSQHWFFALDNSYLRDFLPNMAEMVSITDGMYLSHGLTEMLALRFLDQTGINVLLRGHGGELAKAHLAWPLHTDARVYQFSAIDPFVDYVSARANYVTPGLPLTQILTPEAAAAAGDGSSSSFRKVLSGTTLSPAESCSYLYLRELHRRFTVPSLELFRTRLEVRLPYVDRDFLRALLGAPPEWRDSTDIHRALTAMGIPGLLKVRNSNTGAPADAGPRVEFVMDKFNSLFRRLHVRGFRHYHNFDGWMRTMLLESVQAELLSPHARIATFVDRAALTGLFEATRSGQFDHAYLLQVLLILELWQRENQVGAPA